MAFPSSPTGGQQYTQDGRTWQWDGVAWEVLAVPGPTGPAGAPGVVAATAPLAYNSGTQTVSIDLSAYSTTAAANGLYYPLSGNPSGFLTSAPVTSVAGRTGAITLSNTDISGLGTMAVETATNYLTTATAASTYQPISGMSSYLTSATAASTYFTIANAANKANLASPTFTGVPAAPTATSGTNTTQLATTAFVTAAVPATATHLQALQFASTTAVAKVIDNASQVIAPSVLNIWPSPSNLNGTATSGAGASAALSLTGYTLTSPSAGVAGNARAYHANIAGDLASAMWGASNGSIINFSRRVSMAFRFAQYPSDNNSVTRVVLGKIHGTAVGDLATRGIGVKYVPSGGGFYFYLQVHNGTTLTNVLGSTQYAGGVADLEVVSDGAGNATLYLNGASIATSTAAPTGNTGASATVFAEVESQATTTSQPSVSIGRLYVNTLNF